MSTCQQDTVNILKAECYKFPPLKESDAMFSADSAPEWADGEVCHRFVLLYFLYRLTCPITRPWNVVVTVDVATRTATRKSKLNWVV